MPTAAIAAARPSSPRVIALGVALALALFVAVGLSTGGSVRALLRIAIGLALGATLLGAEFGFSSAFRKAVAERDFSGLRAHLVTFAIAMVIVVPLLVVGEAFGHPLHGFAHGIGITFIVGGLLFGTGMQLAGGCASGTLYRLGGGATKHFGTLGGFIVGSVLAASHIEAWWGLPALPALDVPSLDLWPVVVVLQLVFMAILFRAFGGGRPPRRLVIGGVLLAVLNVATLLVSGRLWSETWGFTLWGSQLASMAGADPGSWRIFQSVPWDVSPFVDGTSIMDLSIPLGALLLGGVTGRFEVRAVPGHAWLAAIAGGVAMGYGARLSGGCNIGAYFSTIASGDPSGWAWALAAAGGSVIGLRMSARLDAWASGRAAPREAVERSADRS